MGQFLTKERQREIIKQSPQFEPRVVIQGLVDAGHELEGLNASFSAFDAITNIPASTVEVGKNIFAALANPLQTGKALGEIGRSGVIKLARKISGGGDVPDSETEAFDKVVGFYRERFGTGRRTLETIERDPTGFLSDIAGIIGGPIGATGKLARLQAVNRSAKPVLNLIRPGANATPPGNRGNYPAARSRQLRDSSGSANQGSI